MTSANIPLSPGWAYFQIYATLTLFVAYKKVWPMKIESIIYVINPNKVNKYLIEHPWKKTGLLFVTDN
jgi:hypothetical protein